jgi:hypothetical protein
MNLNQIACATSFKNTGVGSCYLNPGFIKGFFIVGANEYTQTQLNTLQTVLRAGTLSDDKASRVYPIHGIQSMTANNEQAVTQTMGDGDQVNVRDGFYNMTFTYLDGGLCLHQALRSFNNPGKVNIIFYDQNFTFFGWRVKNNTGAWVMAGVPVRFYAQPWQFNTGAAVTAYNISISMEPTYLNDSLAFFQADFNPEVVKGLQTVALEQVGLKDSGMVQVQAFVGCDRSNMYTPYSTDLATASLWRAYNTSTGAAITISSVTADATIGTIGAQGGWILTLDDSDPDYPGSNPAEVTITWAGPTELDTADISGYEANFLNATITNT